MTTYDIATGREDQDWVMDGMILWASAFYETLDHTGLALLQQPVRGIATYHQRPSDVAACDPSRPARYFTPFRKGTQDPAWSRTVRLRARDLSETEAEAIKCYDARVKVAVDWHAARVADLSDYFLNGKGNS